MVLILWKMTIAGMVAPNNEELERALAQLPENNKISDLNKLFEAILFIYNYSISFTRYRAEWSRAF